MKKLRMGLIGLGWVGSHRHIPAMLRSPHIELVGVCDRNPEKVREWAGEYGLRHDCRSDPSRIEWLDSVDAVSIATPPMQHRELASTLLQLGKHVLTEKPFCMTPEEGRALCEVARASGRTLAVVHNFQFSTAFARMQRDIESGRLGTLRSITGAQLGNPRRRLPRWYQELPLGLFFDESPHLLYLVERLAGPSLSLAHVHRVESTTGNATPASIDVFYDSSMPAGNVPVSLHMRFESPVSEWQLMVAGDRGLGVVDIFRNIYIRLPNDGSHAAGNIVRTSLETTLQHWGQTVTQGIRHFTGRLDYGNGEVFDRFAVAARNHTSDERIGFEAAQRVLDMQHAILAAARS